LASKHEKIWPIKFRLTPSGLMIERVRSNAMLPFGLAVWVGRLGWKNYPSRKSFQQLLISLLSKQLLSKLLENLRLSQGAEILQQL
jgi:hypothetical protein